MRCTTEASSALEEHGAGYSLRSVLARESRRSGLTAHNARERQVCDDQRVRPTVPIVDDHQDFRTSARALLVAEGFDVVEEAADGAEAIEAARRLLPEIV